LEPIRIAAFGSWIVGGFVTAVAVVAMIRSMRDIPARLVALGVAYLGMFIVIVGGDLYLLSLMGDGRLPFLAGIPAFALVGITAIRLRVAASRAFADARKARTE
jgi:hypothetical protein